LPEGIQTFSCNGNQITRIENLPEGIQTFSCNGNQITRIENLPECLQTFYYDTNTITHVDNVEISRINFTLTGYQSIKRIQRRKKVQERCAIETIIESLHDWIWKPACNDYTIGIRPRLDAGFLGL
jgi:hypothetical protein